MDYKRAKEMFFIYYGSKGYMWRGEVLEEYESYHVPEWLEIEWQKEIMIDLKNKMELDLPQKEKWGVINCYLTCNQNFYKKDSIDFLEKHKEEIIKMDDCSKLLVIESIFDHSLPKEKEKRKKIIEKCIKKLRKMFEKEAKKEFTIDKSYYEPYKLSDTFVDDEIKERIKTYIWLFLLAENDQICFQLLII
ncbi:hypothetical protein AGMMS50284_7760 [Clostridia bacterium]|nr:hypothetical protein AGMMS50284_7760 [Clostridia bacterium]